MYLMDIIVSKRHINLFMEALSYVDLNVKSGIDIKKIKSRNEFFNCITIQSNQLSAFYYLGFTAAKYIYSELSF